ncbi:MAG: nucleotidyltransferase domain-containing protein [Fimbriimonadaceae bacterium]|nr:nucleotidyltransferase domain-containing protein [Fimbriimonadaceae bacterium]
MFEHHARAIERLKNAYVDDAEILALVVGGSVSKGWATATSDVDFMVVVSDEVCARRREEDRLMVYRTDLTDYEGGYADGKVTPLGFLRLVAESGSEPARSAFLRAVVLFDRTSKVGDLIERILVYPEEGHEDRVRRFHSQLMIWRWYVGEAAKRDDPYLLARSASEVALFAMRLVLAQNRSLYPYHKWAMRMVEESPDKPSGIVDRLRQLTRTPSVETAQAVVDALHEWRPMEVDYREHCRHFLEDSEWNWVSHPAPIGDR